MRLFMIRHCESKDDILNCYGGCADFDLTDKGIQTANQKLNQLVDKGIEKIYTSPYKRAKSVAKIFSNKIRCDIEIIEDLREMNTYGVMSGVNKELAKDIFSFLLNSEGYQSFGYYEGKPFEGGEKVEDFDNRIKRAFDYIIKQNYQKIAIVTHGGVFRSVYKNMLHRKEKITEIDDVATIEMEYDKNGFKIVDISGIEIE